MFTSGVADTVAIELESIQDSVNRLKSFFAGASGTGGGGASVDGGVHVVEEEEEESNPHEENESAGRSEGGGTASTSFSDFFVHADLSRHVGVGDFVVLVKDPHHGRIGRVVKERGTGYWEVQLEGNESVWKMRSNCWLVVTPGRDDV